MAVEPEDLTHIELLAGLSVDELRPLARRLTRRDLPPDCVVIRQGQAATKFALVVEGQLEVTRDEGHGDELLAVVGPGSIVGELALLRRRTRVATVASRSPATVFAGDREALVTLLHLPAVADRLRSLVSQRLAEDASPVVVHAADGRPLTMRPLLPSDRAAIEAGIDAMSDESLYRRFFTGGRPSDSVIDHLLDVDYLDHFAWVISEPDAEGGLGVARYHRLADDQETAEAALAVVDGQQGRGLGTVLLGALAAAAGAAGVEHLRAEVLTDNRAMRAVLNKAGATWKTIEPGVVVTDVEVPAARAVLDDETVELLERSVREVVTAAGLALARRVD